MAGCVGNIGDLIDTLNTLPITAETEFYIRDMNGCVWSVFDVFVDDDGDLMVQLVQLNPQKGGELQ